MRTNIDIDDDLMNDVLARGPYKTKKEAVEAGLKLIARQAAAREALKLEGKLSWGWDEQEERLNGEPNWSVSPAAGVPAAKPAREAAQKTGSKAGTKTATKAARVSR